MAHPRPHDRAQTATRQIKVSYDGLARSDGSARFSFGDTSALATVSGPIEVRLAAEQPSQATFEVNLRPLSNVPGTDAKSLSAMIRSALAPSLILTQHPRSLIQLSIQALCAPGSSGGRRWKDGLTSAMINASSAALLNAGSVPMRGVVCAVAIGALVDSGQWEFMVDPEDEEASKLNAGGCFAFLVAEGVGRDGIECVWTSWRTVKGPFDETSLGLAKGVALDAVKGVYAKMKESVGSMGARPFVFDVGKVKREVEEEVKKELEEVDEDKMEI